MLRAITIGACVLGSTAALAATATGTPEENTLAALFERHCGDHKNAPKGCDAPPATCEDPAHPSVQWLHLDRYCNRLHGAAEVCEAFGKIREATEHPTLIYDHRARVWWPGGGIPLHKGKLDKDVTGAPLAYLPRRHELVVLIVNTNPLLYGATVAESAEEEIAQVADLETLVTLLGGVMAAADRAADFTESVHGYAEIAPEVATLLGHSPLETAGDRLRLLTGAVVDVQSLIQRVELGTEPVRSKCTFGPPTLEQVLQSLKDLRQLRDDLALLPPDVGKAYAAYLAILDANPTEPSAIEKAKDEFWALVETSLHRATLRRLEVSDGKTDKTLADSVEDIVDGPSKEKERKAFRADAERRRRVFDTASAMLEAVQPLLEKWPEAIKAASQVEVFTERCRKNRIGDKIARWMVLEREDLPLDWDKRQKHTIKIAADSPFAERIGTSHPGEVTTAYRLEWRGTRLFDVGFALTHTSLDSPRFSAVTDPSDSSMKIIGKTGEDSRAGKLAVLVAYQFVQHAWPRTRHWPVRPSLDVGAGLDADTPALFAGASVGVGKYFRVGGGWTWQEVEELDGQRIGDTVASGDDIRTRNAFDRASYVSVMFSLGSLPFFKPK